MTKEEKIVVLRKMIKINFKRNFLSEETTGLCKIFEVLGYEGQLNEVIPELVPTFEREDDLYWFWWETHGRIIPWWQRHKAIYRTINKLEQSK